MQPQVLFDLPMPIETERLTIRPPQPGDGVAFNAAVLDSLDGIRTWLGYYLDGVPTVADSELFIRQKHAAYILRDELMMLALLKGSDTIVASSGLHPRDWRVPMFEIGYWGRTTYSGHGYVTETVGALRDYAFQQLHAQRVFIRCDTDNEASASVARRAGFTLEATLHHDGRKPTGALRSTHVFAQLRQD